MDIISYSKANNAIRKIKELDEEVIALEAEGAFKTVDHRLDWIQQQIQSLIIESVYEVLKSPIKEENLKNLVFDNEEVKLQKHKIKEIIVPDPNQEEEVLTQTIVSYKSQGSFELEIDLGEGFKETLDFRKTLHEVADVNVEIELLSNDDSYDEEQNPQSRFVTLKVDYQADLYTNPKINKIKYNKESFENLYEENAYLEETANGLRLKQDYVYKPSQILDLGEGKLFRYALNSGTYKKYESLHQRQQSEDSKVLSIIKDYEGYKVWAYPTLDEESEEDPFEEDQEELEGFLEREWILLDEIELTEEVFLEHGMESVNDIPSEELQDLIQMDVDLYFYISNESQFEFKVRALPFEQIIVPKKSIKINEIIDELFLRGQNLKMMFSNNNGEDWFVFKSGQWTQVTLDESSFIENGMNIHEVNNLVHDQVSDLIEEELQVAYYFYEKESVLNELFLIEEYAITETPVLELVDIVYKEYSLHNRLDQLEKANMVAFGHLNFKANALMQSEKYSLKEFVIETFATLDYIEEYNAFYHNGAKSFVGGVDQTYVLLSTEYLTEKISDFWFFNQSVETDFYLLKEVVAEGDEEEGEIIQIPISSNQMVDVSEYELDYVRILAVLKNPNARFEGLAYGWG